MRTPLESELSSARSTRLQRSLGCNSPQNAPDIETDNPYSAAWLRIVSSTSDPDSPRALATSEPTTAPSPAPNRKPVRPPRQAPSQREPRPWLIRSSSTHRRGTASTPSPRCKRRKKRIVGKGHERAFVALRLPRI